MNAIRLLVLMVFCTMLLSQGAEAWWGSRRRRRRRRTYVPITPAPTKCTPRNCVYSWGEPSLCNSAGKLRKYANVVSQPSCGGLPCPSMKIEDCSPPNGRYNFNVVSSWSTGANSQLSVILEKPVTDSLVVELAFSSPQIIQSAWPLKLQYIEKDDKRFYFIKPKSYAPLAAGTKILVNFISSQNEGEAVAKPWKITLHGNCVNKIPDNRVLSSLSPDEICSSTDNSHFAAADCTKYYTCVSSSEGLGKKAMAMQCPAGTKWDDDSTACVHGDCTQPKMRDTMCDDGSCPANMYSETLYPAYL